MKSKASILVVEDAPDSVLIIKSTLSDFDVTVAGNLAEANACVDKQVYDLCLLDISLPDGETYALCQKLREGQKTQAKPILFLSSRSGEIDKLSAFAKGADDYVTKPFSPLELKARVLAKLREVLQGPTKRFDQGPLRVDLERRQAILSDDKGERTVALTSLEFDLLVALAARPEVVKTRQQLLDEVWGSSVSVTDRTVDVHIYHLRKKLGDYATMIQSNHGHGYFFKVTAPAKAAG